MDRGPPAPSFGNFSEDVKQVLSEGAQVGSKESLNPLVHLRFKRFFSSHWLALASAATHALVVLAGGASSSAHGCLLRAFEDVIPPDVQSRRQRTLCWRIGWIIRPPTAR